MGLTTRLRAMPRRPALQIALGRGDNAATETTHTTKAVQPAPTVHGVAGCKEAPREEQPRERT